MRGKKAKTVRKLVEDLASPGVDTQKMVAVMKKAYNSLTHEQKRKSNLFSGHTA